MSKTKGKRFANKKNAKVEKKQTKENMNTSKFNHSESFNNGNTNKSQMNKNKNFIFNIIISICSIAIIFSSYNIIVWFIDNYNNKKIASDIYNQVTITEEQITIDDNQITKRHYDLQKLLSQNENTVGWIYVKNSNIDYPVVQYPDNDYYLTHSFDKSNNSAGWVFADYRCDCTNLGYNTVIYGHNRKDASMFGTLQRSLQPEWYGDESNLYINFSTLYENHVYKIFSTFVCNDEDVNAYIQTAFANKDDFSSYVQNLKKHSSHDFGTDISETEQIITLYTCYGLNNQRLLVCATLVD